MKNIATPLTAGLLPALALIAMLAGTTRAEVIVYSDNFSGSGAINGTAPTVRSGQYGGSASATWTANTGITSNGTFAQFSAGQAAYLPFSPQSGFVYTLSMNSSLPGEWGGMGFVNSSNVTDNLNVVPPNKVWLLYQNNKATTMSVTGGGSSATGPAGFNTMQLILDTTNPTWTIQGTFNGTPYDANPLPLGFTGFTHIALSGAYGGVNMNTDSVSLTAVPEPSSMALGGLGVLGGAMVARRSRKRW